MSVAGAHRESRDDPAADRATEPDLEATRRFLRRLDGTTQAFTFQTFSDRKHGAGGDPLARVLHGSLEQHAPRLRQLNRAGAGVFVSVNATDGRGRRTENVERVRALWQEDDGAGQPLPLAPHIVVETSPGHFHRYLLVEGISREEFAAVQQVLVDRYGSDRNAKDLARVLRLPGFFHRKGEPFLVRLVEATDAAPYSREQILQAFPPAQTQGPGPEAGPEDDGEDWVGAGPDTLRDLRSALAWLRADERELWVAVGQALKGLGSAGRGLWIEWSQTSEKWRPEDARVWDTFRGNRTDYRAVFAKAQRMGWVNPRAKATPPGDGAQEEPPTATPSGAIDLGDLPEDIDAYVLPPRPWVVKDRLLRGTVSVLASPGGVGKSAFEIASAVSIAGLVPFTGEEIREHGPVWVYNNEDDRDELLRRYLAFCKHHRISPSSLRGRLRLSSGAGGHPLVIAKRIEATGQVVPTARVKELIRALRDWPCAVFSVDPLVSTHRVNENSNVDLEEVMSQWRRVATETRCAIELPSHIPKTGGDSEAHAGNLEAIRGASAIGAAARQVTTLARMSARTAERYGVAPESARHLVRLDRAKGNYSPPAGSALWLRMQAVSLENHSLYPDWVGVFEVFPFELAAAGTEATRSQGREWNQRAAKLRAALEGLGMKPGERRPLSEVRDELVSRSGQSKSWIYENLVRVLPMHGSFDEETEHHPFTWSREDSGSGGKAGLFLHRSPLP